MSKNWLEKIADKIIREEKSNAIHYRNALQLTEKIRCKYNCGLSELPVDRLTDNEKKLVFKAWLQLGYNEETASLIVYNNKYQYKFYNWR